MTNPAPSKPMTIVVIGLSLSSSWGNGHATTFRSLLRGTRALGHRALFLECERPWFAANRDMPHPDFCELAYFDTPEDLVARHGHAIRQADAVIIGSYVPDGPAVIAAVAALQPERLCFYDIDTPVTLRRLQEGNEEYIARHQVPLFDVYFSFSGGANLDRLETDYRARRAEALFCSVDPDLYRPTGAPRQWDLGYLGTYSDDRQPVLKKLLIEPARRLPERKFVVAGAQYPSSIEWPDNVERIEHVPPAEHADFYSRQRFTLNVTRQDMVRAGWSPSVRLFEAAACATPVISDIWPGLEELLPDGEAIILAPDGDAVVAALRETDDAQLAAIAEAARQRVMSGHTGLARARELIAALASLKGSSAATTASAIDQ
ncbi:MAG: glycosyltransferase [Martelella sp.]|uniref:CgeB family protein n=1 Tax=Martelella sp. TaxID=1969699 RepID=UPI003241C32D